jgi:AP2 domain
LKLAKPRRRNKLTKKNTSGYQGVSWHKGAGKWAAHIHFSGVHQNLGLFKTAEEAHIAYEGAAARIDESIEKANVGVDARGILLEAVKQHYATHGIRALSTLFLEKHQLYHHLLAADLPQAKLLAVLGLTDEYKAWRASNRTYRGVTKPTWSWEVAVAKAKEIKDREGDLPTVEWFRKNRINGVPHAVHTSGRTWEDMRKAVDCFATSNFTESRNGMRWRSRPEASLSNFLYARGIKHKRGERYATGYAEQSGRHHGTLDLHFVSATGVWIDVEVWGDELNRLSGNRYQKTREFKETWQASNPNFLGIPYKQCLSDTLLTEILKPYIGVIDPFQFDDPTDRLIETSHWSDKDDLLVSCKNLAAQMPDGIFPSESWLRKRGKYANRTGPTYNTLAIRVTQWLKGIRNVRMLLGQENAGTTAWTPEKIMEAWDAFYDNHGRTPSQCRKSTKQHSFSRETRTEASKLCEAARRHGINAMLRKRGYAVSKQVETCKD